MSTGSSVTAIVSTFVAMSVLVAIIFDACFAEPGRSLFPLSFRLRRVRNWLPMGIVYCGFYTARYNMAAANVPSVSTNSGMSPGSVPLALSLGFWCYAATAPWTGMYADLVGGRRAILLAAVAATLLNVAAAVVTLVGQDWDMTLRTTITLILYASNIVFQGFGTSAVVKVNAMWYGPQERGTFSGVFNVLVTSGYYAALGAGRWVADRFGFAGLFILPAVLLGGGGILIALWVQNSPEAHWKDIGSLYGRERLEAQPLVESHEGSNVEEKNVNYRTSTEPKKILITAAVDSAPAFSKLVNDAVFICYCAAIFFLSFVRDGLLSWMFAFLESVRVGVLSVDAAALVGAGITVGGFLGGIACGMASDLLFRGSRTKPILVFSAGQIGSLAILWFYGGRSSEWLDALILFLVCFFVCGNYALLNYTIPSDLDPAVIGTAVGLMTTSGYIASGLAGITMKVLIGRGGFLAWIVSLVVASVLAAGAIIVGGCVIAQRRKLAELGSQPLPTQTSERRLSVSITGMDADFTAINLSISVREEETSSIREF